MKNNIHALIYIYTLYVRAYRNKLYGPMARSWRGLFWFTWQCRPNLPNWFVNAVHADGGKKKIIFFDTQSTSFRTAAWRRLRSSNTTSTRIRCAWSSITCYPILIRMWFPRMRLVNDVIWRRARAIASR